LDKKEKIRITKKGQRKNAKGNKGKNTKLEGKKKREKNAYKKEAKEDKE